MTWITRGIRLTLALCALGCGPATRETTSAATATGRMTLRVATSGNYPPMSTWTDNRAQGFAPELLGAFAVDEHAEIAWARISWSDLLPDMRARRYDVAADGITVIPERTIVGRFSVPIARGAAVLLLKRPTWAREIKRLDDPRSAARAFDREELRIAVYPGGQLDALTRNLFHKAKVIPSRDTTKIRDMLARGEIDAAMSDTFEALRWSDGLADVERIGPLGHDTMAFWIAADRQDLAEKLDGWLLEQGERGGLERARTAVLGPGGGPETALAAPALNASSNELFALAPIVASARKRIGRPAVDRGEDDRFAASAIEAVAKAAATRGEAPPSRTLLDTYFRAHADALNALAERVPLRDGEVGEYDLEKEVRPAMARVVARMAFVLVRLRSASREGIMPDVREDLADTTLDPAMIDRLGEALGALAEAAPAPR